MGRTGSSMVLRVGLVGLFHFSPCFSARINKDQTLMTGTDYFSMCFREHIPDEVDLVLIDMCTSTQL